MPAETPPAVPVDVQDQAAYLRGYAHAATLGDTELRSRYVAEATEWKHQPPDWRRGMEDAIHARGLPAKVAASDDVTDYVIPAAGIAAGVGGLVAAEHVGGIGERASRWVHDVNAAREKLPNKGAPGQTHTFEAVDNVMAPYMAGGRDLTRQHIAGVPLHKVLGYGRYASERLPEGIRSALQGRFRDAVSTVGDVSSPLRHYELYSNPATSTDELLHHHLVDVAASSNLPSAIRHDSTIFSPEARKLMAKTQHPQAVIEDLRSAGHTRAAAALDAAWRGGEFEGQKIRGAVEHLAGTDRTTGGIHRYGRVAGMGTKAVPYLRAGGLLGLAAGTAVGIDSLTKQSSADQETDSGLPWSTVSALSGGGAAAAGGALATQLRDAPKKRVGVAYGTMIPIGRGHAEPGEAIHKILTRAADPNDPTFNPGLTGATIDKVVRDNRGLLHGTPQGAYDAMIDTGFGHDITRWRDQTAYAGKATGAGDNAVMRTYAPARVRRYVGYQTDLNPRQANGDYRLQSPTHPTANTHDLNFGWLGYGPGANTIEKLKYNGPGATLHRIGTGLSPAIDPDVLAAIGNETRSSDQVLEGIRGAAREGRVRGVGQQELAAFEGQLDRLKGRKLIVVSGSGRGDYTGSRAARLHAAIAADPELASQYAVVAQHANGYHGVEGDILRAYKASSGGQHVPVEGFGFLPKDLFNALQQTADVHWGSTGTSSLSEASAHGNILAVPGHWGYAAADRRATETLRPNTAEPISDAHQRMARQYGLGDVYYKHPDLNAWNLGNIQYAIEQPGVVRADGPEHIVALLKDPVTKARMAEEAKARSMKARTELLHGQRQIASAIAAELARNQRVHNIRTIGTGLAGLGLAGLSAYSAGRAMTEKTSSAEDDTSLTLAGAGLGAAAGGAAAASQFPALGHKAWRTLTGTETKPALAPEEQAKIRQSAELAVSALRERGLDPAKVRIGISGLGGSGKSTLARELAGVGGMQFRELDHEMQAAGGDVTRALHKKPVAHGSIVDQSMLLPQVNLDDHFDAIIEARPPVASIKERLLRRGTALDQLDYIDHDELDKILGRTFADAAGHEVDLGNHYKLKIRNGSFGQVPAGRTPLQHRTEQALGRTPPRDAAGFDVVRRGPYRYLPQRSWVAPAAVATSMLGGAAAGALTAEGLA